METSSQARPFARPDLRAGLFGLDPRTHLLAVVAFGVASIVLTGLLETALLQVAAALYLAGNGRARLALRSCASFAVVAGLSFLPLPGLYGVLFVSLLHMVPPFTAGCALFSLSPSAIMCALARWRVPQRVLVGVCMLFRFASVLSFEARSIVRGIRLRGVFPLKKMITSPSVSKVKHVMRKEPISVHVDTPIDEVVQTIEKYDLVAVPVVDSIGRLVGRITVDDVMDEVREQAERDYQLASGLSQDVETDDNVFRQTTARLPWLLIGMIGGIGNSMILGNFDSTFAAHPEMALYIPLIGGTGGNVGTQSSALIVQGLANSSLDAQNTWKQIVKESVVAVINATIISMLVYIYNFIRFGASATVTYSVSFSLFAVVMFASIFGTLVPMTLEKLKIDPAIATGPFISITNDIIGMMLYMGITVLLS